MPAASASGLVETAGLWADRNDMLWWSRKYVSKGKAATSGLPFKMNSSISSVLGNGRH